MANHQPVIEHSSGAPVPSKGRTEAESGDGVARASRRVSWAFISLILVAHTVWSVAVNVGFRARLPLLDTLTANLLGLALLVVGLLFTVGKLKPRDVGLRATDLRSGLLFTAVFFVLLQLVLLVVAQVTRAEAVGTWTRLGLGTAAYLLLAQLIGNALYEEIAFRGFLLPQLFLHFRKLGKVAGWAAALLLSQAVFALMHVPNRLWVTGLAPAELPGALLPLFLVGIYFAALYLLTGNLFAVVGVHALNNMPVLALVDGGGNPADGTYAAVVLSLGLLLALLWRWRRSALLKISALRAEAIPDDPRDSIERHDLHGPRADSVHL